MQFSFKDTFIEPIHADDHFWGYILLGVAFCTYTLPALFKSAALWYKSYCDLERLKLRIKNEADNKRLDMIKKAKQRLGK